MDHEKHGSKGGKARKASLPSKRRSEIAKAGAIARWGLRATNKGNFKNDFGIDVDCYVLNDDNKTAVMSQRGMGQAIGLSEGGGAVRNFVGSKVMASFVGDEIREKLENPLKFQYSPGGSENLVSDAYGYDVTLLIDICKAIVAAEAAGRLTARQAGVARQAHIVLGASAKAGIKGLVYALAGYRPEVEEVIHAFKVYVQEEAKKYEKEFPKELYAAWQHLYRIPLPARGKPWQFMHLTRKHIYFPLAKSNGKILDLLRALRAKGGEQNRYLFQFLNEIGARALRMQIGRVLEMAESSGDDQHAYEAKIVERFGGQQELDFAVPKPGEPEMTTAP